MIVAVPLSSSGGSAAPLRIAFNHICRTYAMLAVVLTEGFASGRIRGFSPYAATFFAYLVSHESHHRGQITSLARRLGHPLPKQVEIGMWEWGTRSREAKSASA